MESKHYRSAMSCGRPQSIAICMKITCVVEGLEQIESSEPEDIAREVAED